MPITSDQIVLRLSTGLTTGNGDSVSAVPANSLGGTVSTEVMGTTLFADATASQNQSNQVHYRCFFVLNTHPTLTLMSAKVYIFDQVSGGADGAIAVDNKGPTAKDAAYPQADRIPTQTTEPIFVGPFSDAVDEASALDLGDIGPGQVKAVWARRTLNNTAPQSDGMSIVVKGETDQ